jgi:Reverse transcriptase (RNA-dependent DNA polymerase)
MQYYCFELDDASKELCTIAMPFSLYRYWHLPMGVNQSPDIAQEIMERVLSSSMEEIECYIDDITAFSDDWESHKTLLNKLLTKLQNAGFTVNPGSHIILNQEHAFMIVDQNLLHMNSKPCEKTQVSVHGQPRPEIHNPMGLSNKFIIQSLPLSGSLSTVYRPSTQSRRPMT